MLVNWERMSELLIREGVDALVATSYEHVRYLSGFDNRLPYATGTGAAAIVLPGEPGRGALVVGIPYVAHLQVEPTWLSRVEVFGTLGIEQKLDAKLVAPEAAVAAELARLDGATHENKGRAISAALAALGVTGRVAVEVAGSVDADVVAETVPALGILTECRLIKSPGEIEVLRQASLVNEAAFAAAAGVLKAGNDWREVTRAWAQTWAGAGGLPEFWGGGSGAHASQFWPHQTRYELLDGDVVRWEGGGTLGAYWADTGGSAVIGDGPDDAQQRFDALHAGAEAVRAELRAGAIPDRLCAIALEAIRDNGLPHFQTSNAWGHGIGLSLNEAPRIRPGVTAPLEAGMVICFESPYFELGWGGLQIENTYVITDTGYEQITKAEERLAVAR